MPYRMNVNSDFVGTIDDLTYENFRTQLSQAAAMNAAAWLTLGTSDSRREILWTAGVAVDFKYVTED